MEIRITQRDLLLLYFLLHNEHGATQIEYEPFAFENGLQSKIGQVSRKLINAGLIAFAAKKKRVYIYKITKKGRLFYKKITEMVCSHPDIVPVVFSYKHEKEEKIVDYRIDPSKL